MEKRRSVCLGSLTAIGLPRLSEQQRRMFRRMALPFFLSTAGAEAISSPDGVATRCDARPDVARWNRGHRDASISPDATRLRRADALINRFSES